MRVSVKDCERAAKPLVDLLNKLHPNRDYYYDYYHTDGIVKVNKKGGGIAKVIPNNGRNGYNTELMLDNIRHFVEEMNSKS